MRTGFKRSARLQTPDACKVKTVMHPKPDRKLRIRRLAPRSSLGRRKLASRSVSQGLFPFPVTPAPSLLLAIPISVFASIVAIHQEVRTGVAKHARSLVGVVIVAKQLAVGTIVLRRLDPLSGDNTRQCDSDTGSTVQPSRTGLARELHAEVRCKVVAVLSEEVVGSAGELVRGGFERSRYLFVGGESEAVENLAAKGTSGRFGLGLGPVYPSRAAILVTTVSIFFVSDDDTGVKERSADCPQDRRESAGLSMA